MKAKTLSPAKQTFINEYVKTDSAVESVRRAYPELKAKEQRLKAEGKDYPFIYTKGKRLIRNDTIVSMIADQRQRLALLATKGIRRLDTIITDGKEHNALAASMYVVDQSIGKATQQIETSSQSIMLNIDLTSSITEVDDVLDAVVDA